MKKIVIIQGHPDRNSLCYTFGQAYKKGLSQHSNISVEEIHLMDLAFNPILMYGYKKRTVLEPDLVDAQRKIMEADHTVWIYPTWWGTVPALMKGFIDRIILPGFFFEYQEDTKFAKKLMKGKTARVISTMDAPVWYYKIFHGQPGFRMMKRVFFDFVGIKSKMTGFGSTKYQQPKTIEKWIKKVERLGFKEGR